MELGFVKTSERDGTWSTIEFLLRWEMVGGWSFERIGGVGKNPYVCLSSLCMP